MKRFLRISLFFFLLPFLLFACYIYEEDDDDSYIREDSVIINEPSLSDTYSIADVETVQIAGNAYLQPDNAVSIIVTNLTTEYSTEASLEYHTVDWASIDWSADIPLVPGENVIVVQGTDGQGESVTDQITIYWQDLSPPTISSTNPLSGYLAAIDISITITFSEGGRSKFCVRLI